MYRLWLVALTAALPFHATAHDIPNDVTVQALLKPSGDRLRLLVRAPLAAMRDVEFPQRGPGFIDLPRVGSALHTAATVWIAQNIELYESDNRLPRPRIVAARVSLPSDKSFASYEEAVQ